MERSPLQQDVGALVDAPGTQNPVEPQTQGLLEALPLAPDVAVVQPAAVETVPDVLSPSQDAPEVAVGAIEETQSLAVADDETNVIFPLARIKKIIKADPEVKTVNKEALQLIGKATELLLSELARAALNVAEKNKRKTVNYNDVATVVRTHEVFCFLEDTVRPSPGESNKPTAQPSMPEARMDAPKRPREDDILPDSKQTKISFEAPKPEAVSRGLTKVADIIQPPQEPAPDSLTEALPAAVPMDAE